MLETLKENKLEYIKLSPEEMKERGILGRLVGICADFVCGTRNGRKYSESLWEKVFSSDLMKEKIENKVCYGELNHPFDGRTDVDMEKVAINLTEKPKKGTDGKLRAVFDILDTPAGRILNTLAKYGSNLGVSSRGDGDTFINRDGEEEVDENTYTCFCFDIVPVPAVKEARLTYVTESLNENSNLPLKQALLEQLNNETDLNAKKIMTETIKSLNIDSLNINESVSSNSSAANDIGASVVKDLQEALKKNKKLEDELTTLQEKLSVCYAKESKQEDRINGYKSAIVSLTESSKEMKVLQEQLKQKDEQIANYVEQLNIYEEKYSELKKEKRESMRNNSRLTESLNENNAKIGKLSNRVKELLENIRINEQNFENEKSDLIEQLEELKKDSYIKNSEYSDKLSKLNSLVEKYKRIAKKSIDKYIDSRALALGIRSSDIREKLQEDYSFEEIDKACDDLRQYKINMNRLPFDLQSIKSNNTKVSVNESVDPLVKSEIDQLDDSDLKLFDNFMKKQ